jgi:hypothetical protein
MMLREGTKGQKVKSAKVRLSNKNGGKHYCSVFVKNEGGG